MSVPKRSISNLKHCLTHLHKALEFIQKAQTNRLKGYEEGDFKVVEGLLSKAILKAEEMDILYEARQH